MKCKACGSHNPSGETQCLDCSRPLDQKAFKGNPYVHGLKIGDHWVDKQCAYNDHGIRCASYGILSTATNGEGPFYCRPCNSKLLKEDPPIIIDRKEGISDVDRRVNRMVLRLDDESMHDWTVRCREWTLRKLREISSKAQPIIATKREWAGKIVSRVDAGLPVSVVAETMARDQVAIEARRRTKETAEQAEQAEPADTAWDDEALEPGSMG